MDHLPLPKRSPLDPIEVPYSCTSDYDGGPMLEYPIRCGWKVKYSPYGIRYLDENGVKPTNAKLEAFIQTWLYFGFLHELFGDFADIKSFVTQNSRGKPVVTTAPLQNCLEVLFKRWKGDSPPYGPDGLTALQGVSQLNHFVGKISLNTKSVYRNKEVDDRIWLSIAILSETLNRIHTNHFLGDEDEGIDDQGVTWRAQGNPTFGQFLVDEMAEKGWCPFDIDRIDKTATSATLFYYMAHLPPPRPNVDHSLCTKDVCTSMTIDPSYRTKHVPKNCQCNSEFSDTPSVINGLRGDEIPLIQEVIQLEMLQGPAKESDGLNTARFIEATDVEPKFRIIESGKGRNFVAISHVWAEGLGNPNGNSLPSCALKWISSIVDRFQFHSDDESEDEDQQERPFEEASQGKTPFWLDTICVPVSPPEMWTRAMNRLRKPYQDAALVLVLDSYLYTQDTKDIDAPEMWARILCCSWSRRLWTFQEGRLAKPGRLWIQFKDTAMSMEDIWRRFNQTLATEELLTELHLKWRGSNTIRGLAETGGPVSESTLKNFRPEPDVWDMRESLKARAVSVPTDEVLCLFCNMGLDMELVMRTPPEERLAVFWRNVRKIPVGLVFSTAPQKMTVPGLRWAPTSFLGSMEKTFWYIEQSLKPRRDGFVTQYGLQIQVPALLCDPKLLLWEESYETIFENADSHFALRDEEGYWYFVETRDFWNQSRTERPKANERLAFLHVQHIEDLDRDSTGALGQTTGDPFDFKLSVQAVLGTVENAVSSEEEKEEEGSRGIDEAATVLERPPDTPDPKDLPRFRGYRHLSLHRFSDAMCEYYRAIAATVEVFVAIECGYQVCCVDETGEEVDLLSKMVRQQPENDTNSETVEVSHGGHNAPINAAATLTGGNGTNGGEELAQDLEDLDIKSTSEYADSPTKAEDRVDSVGQGPEVTVPDGQRREEASGSDTDEHEADTDDEDESSGETPDTYTLKESSRDLCQMFADRFARFDTHTRNITLAVGANAGRDEEQSYDHFAKSARFQLQMRRRNGMKRLKRETWWIID
ncbi:hypothetical protein SLS63_013164 [Diaporthe eres]|uniref:Heterokaryon incompatibility domain-containing protein n=1 Tax=Diaporthe eres TaxID=83184 RepID=A0ABR1NP81_DIAER